MRRSLVLLVTFLLALASYSSAGEKKDKQAEGLALIERARELSDIRAPGSPPFRLEAKVEVLGPNGSWIDGTYSLLRLSSEKSREEINLPGYREVRVATGDKVWQVRNVRYMPLHVFQLREALQVQSRLKLEPKETIKKIRERRHKGSSEKCTTVKVNEWTERELCFDEATGAIVSEKSWKMAYEYSDFLEWRGKVLPRSVRAREEGQEVVRVKTVEIIDAEAPDLSQFEPPPGAAIKQGCDNPEPAEATETQEPVYPDRAKRAGVSGIVSIYAVIGLDGTLHNPTLVRTAGPDLDSSAMSAVSRWRYRPAMCGGKPVESETVIDVGYRLYYP